MGKLIFAFAVDKIVKNVIMGGGGVDLGSSIEGEDVILVMGVLAISAAVLGFG